MGIHLVGLPATGALVKVPAAAPAPLARSVSDENIMVDPVRTTTDVSIPPGKLVSLVGKAIVASPGG